MLHLNTSAVIRGGSRICGKGGGRSGYRERHRREGFWRVPFEDPLWNFKRGARAPCAPLNPLVVMSEARRKKKRKSFESRDKLSFFYWEVHVSIRSRFYHSTLSTLLYLYNTSPGRKGEGGGIFLWAPLSKLGGGHIPLPLVPTLLLCSS